MAHKKREKERTAGGGGGGGFLVAALAFAGAVAVSLWSALRRIILRRIDIERTAPIAVLAVTDLTLFALCPQELRFSRV
jgi:hypothetical protein